MPWEDRLDKKCVVKFAFAACGRSGNEYGSNKDHGIGADRAVQRKG